MPLVKSIFVKLSSSGGPEAKREIDDVARRALELSKMDPTVRISAKVDKDGFAQLRGMRLQLEALKLAGADPVAFRGLASRVRGVGSEAEGARLRMSALRLELDALKKAAEGEGGGTGGFLSKILGANVPLGPLGSAPLGGIAAGAAVLPAFGSIISGTLGIIPLLASATMGLGAFAAVALPTLSSLRAGITGVSTATENYQAASAALGVAIRKSPADLAAYKAVLTGLEPDLAKAAVLLTNQNATWQGLSPSMRKNVVALSDNSAALKTLLPDQRKALDALLAERTAWNNLTPAQQKAAAGYQKLSASFGNLEAKLAPVVLKIANVGLDIANKLMPWVGKFAQAAAPAVLSLVKSFDKFASSAGFKSFMNSMLKLTPGSILAIGKGIGQLAGALGGMLKSMISPNGLKALQITFDIISGGIKVIGALAGAFAATGHAFDNVVHAFGNVGHALADAWRAVGHAWDNVQHAMDNAGHAVDTAVLAVVGAFRGMVAAGSRAVSWFAGLPGRIGSALGSLGGILYSAGAAAMQGLLAGLEAAAGSVFSFVAGIASKIASLKGPIEKDRVLLVPAGMAIMDGLYQGMHRGRKKALDLAAEIGVQISRKLMTAFLSGRDKVSDPAETQIAALIRARIGEIRAFVVGIAQQEAGWASLASAAQGPAFSNPRWIPGHAGTPGGITFSHEGGPVVTPGSGAVAGHWAGGVKPPTGAQLLRNLRLDLGRLKAFGHVLGRLRHMGLDQALISQLIAAGPDQGYQIAEAILDAGRGEIRQLDRTENQIWQAGVGIGKTAARSHFGSGVNVIMNFNGFIAGNPRAIAREIQKLLADLRRANGGKALGLG